MLELSEVFKGALEGPGSPEGVRYKLTNPVRFTMLRSRQTVDVSAQTSPSQRQRMFLLNDAGLAGSVVGPDVLTDEPKLIYGTGISAGYAFGIYGMSFETDSANSTPANARLTQAALRGATAQIDRTNRKLLGPWQPYFAGDPVNREDLIDGGGTTTVDAGVVLGNVRTILQPNPLVVYPRDELKPEIGYNGANFAALNLTEDFQLIWTLLVMVADVEPVGSAPPRRQPGSPGMAPQARGRGRRRR
jgi:hypothetical protein